KGVRLAIAAIGPAAGVLGQFVDRNMLGLDLDAAERARVGDLCISKVPLLSFDRVSDARADGADRNRIGLDWRDYHLRDDAEGAAGTARRALRVFFLHALGFFAPGRGLGAISGGNPRRRGK